MSEFLFNGYSILETGVRVDGIGSCLQFDHETANDLREDNLGF